MTPGQLSLDDEVRARRTDPDTSHAAAASVTNLTPARAFVLDMLRQHGPLTDEEIANVYAALVGMARDVPLISPSGLRTRRSELARAGYVRDSGRRGRTASGRPSIIWEARPSA